MIEGPLAPYLLWAKTRQPAAIDLAGSNLLPCHIDDLPGAREAVDLAAPNDNGYAPVIDAIAAHYAIDRARVVTATGCSGANFIVMAALVGAGDDVLIERPAYDPLVGAARLMGANVIRFARRFEDGFRLDIDAVRGALTPRTRLIVVTTPHNPSGVAMDIATLDALAALAASAGAHVLVDEVYLDAACLVAGLPAASRSAARGDGPVIVTSSLTKSYGLAGLRAGWAIAQPAVAERLRRARDVIDNASSGPSDRLAAVAWTALPRLQARTRAILDSGVAQARAFFATHPMFELPEPASCNIVFPRLRGVDDAGAFVQRLLDERGVAVAPGRFFEAPAHFRINLGTGLFSTAFPQEWDMPLSETSAAGASPAAPSSAAARLTPGTPPATTPLAYASSPLAPRPVSPTPGPPLTPLSGPQEPASTSSLGPPAVAALAPAAPASTTTPTPRAPGPASPLDPRLASPPTPVLEAEPRGRT